LNSKEKAELHRPARIVFHRKNVSSWEGD
jgi:hypothetical protein